LADRPDSDADRPDRVEPGLGTATGAISSANGATLRLRRLPAPAGPSDWKHPW